MKKDVLGALLLNFVVWVLASLLMIGLFALIAHLFSYTLDSSFFYTVLWVMSGLFLWNFSKDCYKAYKKRKNESSA